MNLKEQRLTTELKSLHNNLHVVKTESMKRDLENECLIMRIADDLTKCSTSFRSSIARNRNLQSCCRLRELYSTNLQSVTAFLT